MSRSLAARVARLEAKHRKDANRVVGVIGGLPKTYGEEFDGVLYLRRPETPTGQPFVEYARNQQNALQAELLRLFANPTDEAPQPEGIAAIVGNEPLAPLPKNKKRARYIEVNGVEIDTLALRGNRK